MPRLIRLTDSVGDPLWIDPAKVTVVAVPSSGYVSTVKSLLWLCHNPHPSGENAFAVAETPDQVATAVNEAMEVRE